MVPSPWQSGGPITLASDTRERIGSDRRNSTKPLRKAITRVEEAKQALVEAKEAHAAYLAEVDQVNHLRLDAAEAGRKLKLYEAARARDEANELQRREARARALDSKLGGTEPPSVLADDDLANLVADALAQWRSQPPIAPPSPQQRTSRQIREELDALPAVPEGDIEPHDSVMQAAAAFDQALIQLESHARMKPTASSTVSPLPVTDQELYELIQSLDKAVPAVPPDLFQRVKDAEEAAAQAQRRDRLSIGSIGIGVALAVVGLALLVTVHVVAGVLVTLSGAAFGLYGLTQRRRVPTEVATRQLTEARTALRSAEQRAEEAIEEHERADARCAELGIAAESGSLRNLLDARLKIQEFRRNQAHWEQRRDDLQVTLDDAASALARALADRGYLSVPPNHDGLRLAVDSYHRDCRERAARSREAARRNHLLRELQVVEKAEQRVAADQLRRDQASREVTAAAELCGLVADDAESAVEALEKWLQERSNRLADLTNRQKDWATLQELLDGQSLADLEAACLRAIARANELCDEVESDAPESIEESVAHEHLPRLREDAAAAEAMVARKTGELAQFEKQITSVAEAEEALCHAEVDLMRIRELKDTLDRTRDFLRNAQDRIHRDITPVLVQTLNHWLPKVTDGRYTDAIVDPASLKVQVRGESGPWRAAELLSHGTAEQIYLLLRIALADHVTRGHDTCPLLLDDVTVHTDAERTSAILNLLLEITTDRQVILFTQEQEVARWAQHKLTGPHHKLHTLRQVELV
ncbi:ATP-binding protein [Mycolicibacterium thermoresistibile]|uniref:AAA domain protein n=1 Tax=Mycolicibacterium thermoresistibile TaxID=1797 RepID=A0A100XF27_MYCTH|nr:hypothetical protein [Mycolicibacterium thermoresistibile]MCV7191176.1 hypothetical protein [Mycolicibacterium thermoresistibile]GAT15472.1 AAA domain protein [Mycolicibacterium thermoresistibile]